MRLLLDTHVFIWWDSEPDKLSPRVLALCEDKENTLLLSVASAWEIQVKMQLGKLKLHPIVTPDTRSAPRLCVKNTALPHERRQEFMAK